MKRKALVVESPMKTPKRVLMICIAAALSLGLFGCANASTGNSSNGTIGQQAKYDASSLDSILEYISAEGESASSAVTSDSEELASLLEESYDADKVSEFYDNAVAIARAFNSNTKEALIDYCRCVASQGADYSALDDCYNAFGDAAQGFYNACGDAYSLVGNKCQSAIEATRSASNYQAAQEAHRAFYEALREEYGNAQDNGELLERMAQGIVNGNTDIDAIIASQE